MANEENSFSHLVHNLPFRVQKTVINFQRKVHLMKQEVFHVLELSALTPIIGFILEPTPDQNSLYPCYSCPTVQGFSNIPIK